MAGRQQAGFHPVVAGWFAERFGTPTEPQAAGWPAIADGGDVLIAAPTGSGKTLAAFLTAIDALMRQALAGRLEEAAQVVYVSPLKALANDVHKNLEQPLAEIAAAAGAQGYLMPPVRVGVRTGDTLPAARSTMLRRPPHLLVTTPESLYILLTSAGGRRMLKTTRTVIVDEIHALAGNKRGAHLALSLERLDHLTQRPAQRIGLSATVKPLETVAAFLVGARPRPHTVVVKDERRLDLGVEAPVSELGPIATNEQWEERYARLQELAEAHRSTLVFVSTRRMAERVAHRMRERLGEEAVAAHHGSLSRQIRLRAEELFKAGKLRMMVATASLELGLDIGSVDLVCQLGSTRQLASAWQRAGRAGHWRGATPKARFFALTRDDLIECAALVRGLRRGEMESLRVPPWPRDILAQQIVAAVAAEERPEGWGENELYELLCRASPYRELPRAEYDALIAILSEGIAGRRGRRGAFLHRDGVHRRLRPRRGARLAAITCGGAIAETASYVVQLEPENVTIGSLDEDFAIESNAGDVILLGTHSWKVRGVETGRVRVEDAHGAPPTVPFWLGEAPGRTRELSALVSEARAEMAARADPAWLRAECGLDDSAARQTVAYLTESRLVLGAMPTTQHLIAERFFDDGGGMQLVIHAPFGSAINKAWGMALRKRFCRGFDFELQAAASENGLTLALSEQHSFPLETIFEYLSPRNLRAILEQAVLQAPIFQTRWRWTVARALALLRFSGGRRLAPQLQRMRSEDLLAAVFPMQLGCQDNHGGEDLEIPEHPFVQETMRDCLHEFLDLDGLREVLAGIESGAITVAAIDTPAPSGLAQEILNVGPFGFLDDAPLEERRARAVNLRQSAPATAGRLDPEAVAAVCAEAWPQPQSADELHDLLLSLFWLPQAEVEAAWRGWLQELAASARVLPLTRAGRAGWIAAERAPMLAGAQPETSPAGAVWPGVEFAGAQLSPAETAHAALVGGWMEILGPVTAAALSQRLGLEPAAVEQALLALEGAGRVLRGNFLDHEAHAGLGPAPEKAAEAGQGLKGSPARPSASGTRAGGALGPAPGKAAEAGQGPKGSPARPSISGTRAGGALGPAPEEAAEAGLGLEGSPARPSISGTRAGGALGPAPINAWCERGLLARIHRRMVRRLRAEIEPVSPALFYRFLTRWQHLEPATRLHGVSGLQAVLEQLQGFEAPASAWEAALLPARIAGYTPEMLDQLCLSGEFAWARLTPSARAPGARKRLSPTRNSPITFFRRADAGWLLPLMGWMPPGSGEEAPRLSPEAGQVLARLRQRGASFFAELAAPGTVTSQLEDGIWELVAAGFATADGFDNLRAFLDPKRRSGQGRGQYSRPRHSPGRWALVDAMLAQAAAAAPAGADGHAAANAELHRAERAERQAQLWLRRYGVIFRALLQREHSAVPWYEVLLACRRLEARGEIRGGRFVAGFAGEQYALPQAVEALRALRRQAARAGTGEPASASAKLAAADPLNLNGIILPGERIAAHTRTLIAAAI